MKILIGGPLSFVTAIMRHPKETSDLTNIISLGAEPRIGTLILVSKSRPEPHSAITVHREIEGQLVQAKDSWYGPSWSMKHLGYEYGTPCAFAILEIPNPPAKFNLHIVHFDRVKKLTGSYLEKVSKTRVFKYER